MATGPSGEYAIASANDGRVFVWGLNVAKGYIRSSDLTLSNFPGYDWNGAIVDVELDATSSCVKIGSQVTSEKNVVSVNASRNESYTTLKDDGTVHSMGQNSYQFNNPRFDFSLVKEGRFLSIGSYDNFSLGLRKDGKIVIWDGNPDVLTLSDDFLKNNNVAQNDIAEIVTLYSSFSLPGSLTTAVVLMLDGRVICSRSTWGNLGRYGISFVPTNFITRKLFKYENSGILLSDTGRLFKIDCDFDSYFAPWQLIDSPIDVTDAIKNGLL